MTLVSRAALVVLVLGAMPFLRALDAGFVYDDLTNLVYNGGWRGLSSQHLRWMATEFHAGHWMPLTWLSFAVDYAWLGGVDPSGALAPAAYHRTNLVLHAVNAALVFAVLLTVQRRLGVESVAVAGGCALFWAWHPLRVESVAWVTERRDVLAATGYLVAVLAYLRATAEDVERPAGWWALALVATGLSLLAKAWAITLPAVLLAIDGGLPRRRASVGRLVLEKLPFALLAIPVGWLAVRAQSDAGAMVAAAGHTPVERLVQACYGLGWYVAKTVWPSGLIPIYVLEDELDPAAPEHLAGMAFVAVVSVATLALAWRGRRGPLAVWVAYGAILGPVLGLTQSGEQKVADRYSYLALIPVMALVAVGLARVARSARARQPLAAAGLVVLALLVWRTDRQTAVWHNPFSLWGHTLAHAPDSFVAMTGRAVAYSRGGEPQKSLADFRRALELEPRFGPAMYGLAVAYDKLGKYEPSLALFDRLIALRPEAALPRYGRGRTLMSMTRYDEAIAAFGQAIDRRPAMIIAWNNRGICRWQLKDWEGAAADLRQTVALDPGHWKAQALLGDALARLGRRDEARRALEAALERAPADDPQRPVIEAGVRRLR